MGNEGYASSLVPWRGMLLYVVLGVAWVFAGDVLLAHWVTDPALLTRFQTWKGWGYVALTSGLAWWLLRRMRTAEAARWALSQELAQIASDILARRFLTAGVAAWLVMLPLLGYIVGLLTICWGLDIIARGELDNIAGIVLTHKVMNEYIETGVLNFEKHLREPVIVHENAQVLMVMEQLRQAPLQMAIVLNEYGSIEGIATPIDVLEAIAGEFPDEDELETAAESLEDGTLMLEGSTDIRHVSLLLGRDLVDESEQYSTLSGYILFHLGRLPENGARLSADGHIFEVVTMDGHKIEKVHVTPVGGNLRPN